MPTVIRQLFLMIVATAFLLPSTDCRDKDFGKNKNIVCVSKPCKSTSSGCGCNQHRDVECGPKEKCVCKADYEPYTLKWLSYFHTPCFVAAGKPCEEHRAEAIFTAEVLDYYLTQPLNRLQGYVTHAEHNLKESTTADNEDMAGWQADVVIAQEMIQVLKKAGMFGRNKSDWGCLSGRCQEKVCSAGVNPALDLFNPIPAAKFTTPKRAGKDRVGSSLIVLSLICTFWTTGFSERLHNL